MTKDVISLSISVLLLFRHYISHKLTFGAPSSGGVLCTACGAFIAHCDTVFFFYHLFFFIIFTQRAKINTNTITLYNNGKKSIYMS